MRKETFVKAYKILKNDGVEAFWKQTKVHLDYKKAVIKSKIFRNKEIQYEFKDVLLINDCTIEYCERYRLHHKVQELESYGLSCSVIQAPYLSPDLIKYYRAFVIYRSPWSEHMETFVNLVHTYNKVVFYDIDDLIFDLKFTNTIKELKKMTKEERKLYDSGVVRYRKMLELCDYGITTTSVIAEEMKKHVKDACIDKNIASLQMQKFSNMAIKEVKKSPDKVVIGYASGSLTHNADFELITPALIKIMEKYDNVYLKIIGCVTVPEKFKKFKNRVVTQEFVDYTKLPYVLRSLDINLAPLEDTIFNAAKSCIKWMEAGLVKIPTVASDVGDFHNSIKNNVDGVLCKDSEWYEKLEKLVVDKEYREKMGIEAYNTVYRLYTPITNGKILSDFIKSKIFKNVCFLLPSANISGGIIVAIKHALILKKQGYDVVMLNVDYGSRNVSKLFDGKDEVPVISTLTTNIFANIDMMVATFWNTVFVMRNGYRCNDFRYLVQNRESGFYEPDRPEILYANSSYYVHNLKYLTISKWCKKWLETDFNKKALYAPNGIDLSLFPFVKRTFKGKIRILIEGDSASYYKNVDEAFKITNRLDKEKYEIHYLSYNAEPKEWYQVDKFFCKVDHNKVHEIYQNCDILLKTSLLESFSYPPLEMMATGGVSIVVPNDGNVEYLVDGENCLFYKQGDIDDAIKKIENIVKDDKLREKIIKNGLETAKSREWKKIEKQILELYL